MHEAVVFIAPTEPFVLSNAGERTYRKELAYEGEFVDARKRRFTIDEALLLHWARTHAEFLADGIEVPVPVEHTEDPEKKRAIVLSMETGVNAKGLKNISAVVKFNDAEAEKLKHANVSIYVPPEFTSGKGKRYVRPIRHVALTDYPVIPGLGSFEPIAASLVGGTPDMALRDIATKLGVPAEVADDALEAAVTEKVDSLIAQLEELKKPKEGAGDPPKAIAASLLGVVRDNRSMKLDSLVRDRKITPAVRKKLETQFCGDEALTLSLSNDGKADGFDAVIDSLKDNDPIALGEHSKGQVDNAMLLSHPSHKPENNPLLADAERRAAEAKK